MSDDPARTTHPQGPARPPPAKGVGRSGRFPDDGAGPYREAAPRPPKPPPAPCPAAVARRTSLVTPWPLAVMAIAFFLPAVESCYEAESPFDASIRDAWMAAWVVPPYAVAALLAGFTVVAWRRGRSPSRPMAWTGAIAVLVGIATSLSAPLRMVTGKDSLVALGLGLLVAAAVDGAIVARAMQKRGYARWFRLLGAHTMLATPLGVFFAGYAQGGGLRLGGFVYEGALLALVGAQIAGAARIRRARARRAIA